MSNPFKVGHALPVGDRPPRQSKNRSIKSLAQETSVKVRESQAHRVYRAAANRRFQPGDIQHPGNLRAIYFRACSKARMVAFSQNRHSGERTSPVLDTGPEARVRCEYRGSGFPLSRERRVDFGKALHPFAQLLPLAGCSFKLAAHGSPQPRSATPSLRSTVKRSRFCDGL